MLRRARSFAIRLSFDRKKVGSFQRARIFGLSEKLAQAFFCAPACAAMRLRVRDSEQVFWKVSEECAMDESRLAQRSVMRDRGCQAHPQYYTACGSRAQAPSCFAGLSSVTHSIRVHFH